MLDPQELKKIEETICLALSSEERDKVLDYFSSIISKIGSLPNQVAGKSEGLFFEESLSPFFEKEPSVDIPNDFFPYLNE